MRKGDVIVVAIALLLVALAVWWFTRPQKKVETLTPSQPFEPASQPPSVVDYTASNEGDGQKPTATQNANSTSSTKINRNRVIKKGSIGIEVRAFQTLLNKVAEKKGTEKIKIDGDWRTKTDAAFSAAFSTTYGTATISGITLNTICKELQAIYQIDCPKNFKTWGA